MIILDITENQLDIISEMIDNNLQYEDNGELIEEMKSIAVSIGRTQRGIKLEKEGR